eukprot:12934752-Prorocentrum_lima.AAC.1
MRTAVPATPLLWGLCCTNLSSLNNPMFNRSPTPSRSKLGWPASASQSLTAPAGSNRRRRSCSSSSESGRL